MSKNNEISILDQFYEETNIAEVEGTLEDLLKLPVNDQYNNSMEERMKKRDEYDNEVNNRKFVALKPSEFSLENIEKEKESDEEFLNQLKQIDLLTKKSKKKQS